MVKTLLLGIEGSGNDITSVTDMNNIPSLFDYDLVIFNPLLLWQYDSQKPWNTILADKDDTRIFSEITNRLRKDATLLLERGGAIVCLVKPIISMDYQQYSSKRGKMAKYHLTNYDWIPVKREHGKFVDCIKRGNGTGLKVTTTNTLSSYLNMDGIEWEAYFDNLDNLEIDSIWFDSIDSSQKESFTLDELAKNNANKNIAISINLAKGKIIFLPELTHEKFIPIIIDLISKYHQRSKSITPPSWLKNYQIEGENENESKINECDEKIKSLIIEKDSLKAKLAKTTSIKRLLYEQSDELEDAVKEAFEELGFTMQRKGDKDWIASADGKEAIIEVTGRKDDIDIRKARQLIQYWQEESLSGDAKSAILVANHFIGIEPEQRNPPFTEKALEQASVLGFTLLTTHDLFLSIQALREGTINSESIREKLWVTTGLCILNP